MDDESLTVQQRQMLIELHGIADQIRKGHYLNVHFRAFQLAHASWQEHIRQNAMRGARATAATPSLGNEEDDHDDT